MKLVQKTLLASAVAVAFSGAAFADVTVSGKVAGEAQFITKAGNSKNDALFLDSEALKMSFDGKYDIIGGNQAGFKFALSGKAPHKSKHETGENMWRGGQAVAVDKSSLFVTGDWGTFAFGRLAVPTDDIKNDIWDNAALAGSNGEFVGGSIDNALAYSYGNDDFTIAAAVSADNKQFVDTKANKKRKMVTGDQFVSDVAATVKVGPATLKAGAQYNAQYQNTSKKGVVGVDYEADGLLLTGTVGVYGGEEIATDLLLGASYDVSDLVTGKFTFAMQDIGDKANEDGLNPMQFSLGADYKLAKNITAFTVLSYKNKDNFDYKQAYKDATGKEFSNRDIKAAGLKVADVVKPYVKNAKDQVGLGVGLTVKF